METIELKQEAQTFFNALRKRSLAIIPDSSSRGSRAVFRIIYCSKHPSIKGRNIMRSFYAFLIELGFKQSRKENGLFIYQCAGQYAFYIIDAIMKRLEKRGINRPKDWDKIISYVEIFWPQVL